MLRVITPPLGDPVTLDAATAHLRASGVDDESYIYTLIRAATDYVEQFTNRQLNPATYELLLDSFPCDAIHLPIAPIIQINSIEFTAPSGVDGVVTGFELIGNHIVPALGTTWPSTANTRYPVRIEFVAGYVDDVPPSFLCAIHKLVGDLYENREAQQGFALQENKTVERLLWPYRVFA